MQRSIQAALLCAVVLLSACGNKADRIEAGLRKGAELIRKGELDKAGVEVRNVLQMAPKSAQAYYLAGQIDDARGAIRPAYLDYSKAVDLKPDFIEAKVALARVYLLGGDADAASRLVNEVLAQQPANALAQALHLALLARQGSQAQAIVEARRLVAANPALPADAVAVLAGLLFNGNEGAAALTLLDKALSADAGNRTLRVMAAELAGTLAADDAGVARADNYYQAALREQPDNDALWRQWSRMHQLRGNLDRAEVVLRQAAAARPDDSNRTLVLLSFLANARGPEAAEKGFSEAISAHPKDMALRFALADFHAGRARADDARKVLQDIVALGADAPAGLAARSRLAAASLAEGNVEQARSALAEVLKVNPRDAAALVLQGRIKLATGDAAGAVIDLRSASKDQPGSAEIAALLAQAHRAAGEPQLARDVLAAAVKARPEDPAARLLLAQDSLLSKDFTTALAEVEQASKVAPRDPRPAQMKIQIALAQGDAAAAEKAALAMQSVFPRLPDGYLALGRQLAAQHRTERALAQFDIAAKLAPGASEPVVAAIGLLIADRRLPAAQARLDALPPRQPVPAYVSQLRGELALAKGDLAAAEQAFRELVALNPQRPSAYKNVASVMVARGDLPGALKLLDEGARANPKDLTLELARADWLISAGRTDEGVASYEALLKRTPQNDTVANNLAYALSEQKQDPASLSRALGIASRFADSKVPGQVDTLAMVHYRMGQYDQAVSLLQRAVALAPTEPLLQLHFGMALVKSGDIQRGRLLLRKAFDSKLPLPNLPEARALIAQG